MQAITVPLYFTDFNLPVQLYENWGQALQFLSNQAAVIFNAFKCDAGKNDGACSVV